MPVRNIRRASGTSSLKTVAQYIGRAIDLLFDSADSDILKYKDNAGTVQKVVTEAIAATLTNKTLTAPVLNDPVISGAGAIQAKTNTAAFDVDSGTTGTTLTDITGLTGIALVAGATYRFHVICSLITQTVNCGSKAAFKLTTATLTAINARVRQSTDTNNTGEVSTSFTTTTDQATWFAQNAVVYTNFEIEGTLTVGTGGTIAVQAAQNAAHADNTTIAAGAIAATFTRIS